MFQDLRFDSRVKLQMQPQSGGRSTVEQGTNPAKAKGLDAAKSGVAGGSLQNGAEVQPSQIQLQASGAATGAPAASPSSPPVPPASPSQQVTVTAAAPEVANETVEISALNKKEANLPAMSSNVIDPAMLPPSKGGGFRWPSVLSFPEVLRS